MVYCSYCGTENLDGNSHCSNCGKPLPLIENRNQHNPQNNYPQNQNNNPPNFSNQRPNTLHNRSIKDDYLRDSYDDNSTDRFNNPPLDNRRNQHQDLHPKQYSDRQFNNKNDDSLPKTVDKTAVEWDVVIATALIVIIISAVLQRIFPLLAIFMALLIGLIYILIATKSKLSLFKSIPLAILMILAVSAYFSL